MKTPILLAALLLASLSSPARENEPGDDRGGLRRVSDDVTLRLSWRGDSRPVRIRVRNHGVNDQAAVQVRLTADGDAGTELWSTTVALRSRRSATFRVPVVLPEGTEYLEATATLVGAEDEDPADNVVRVPVGAGSGGGGDGMAALGATLYAANCASCHGADARGIGEAEWIRGSSADRVFEAIREGEEEMPAFPGLSWDDARALAAFLLDPEGVTPPPPPPPPPPGTAPTYSGQVKALLDARCKACHAGTSAAGNIRLDTQRWATANAEAALAASTAGRMPKSGALLTEAELALLSDWIAGGKKP